MPGSLSLTEKQAPQLPELPEVETTRNGIAQPLRQARITGLSVRNRAFRWPIPENLDREISGKIIQDVRRRGKYLLLDLDSGSLIIHLGMSGSLRIVPAETPPGKHDHVDLMFGSSFTANSTTETNTAADNTIQILRFRDPRRFGALLWQSGNALVHPLLLHLGPEPLDDEFNAARLKHSLAHKRVAIKSALMDSRIVVGVGNIYANESLYHAGIAPHRPASSLTDQEYPNLVTSVRAVLQSAIEAGGSSLRDFVNSQGNPGYFQQSYFVYGRAGKPCHTCGNTIQHCRIGQRATFWCETCQNSPHSPG